MPRARITRLLPALLVATSVTLAASACTPQATADDWMLEPVPFESGHMGEVDLAFGMSTITADGAGGFWSGSAGSWLHVGADGETLARFNIDVEHPMHAMGSIAALSPTELVATRTVTAPDAVPGLSIIDMETLEYTDVPTKPVPETGAGEADAAAGDFMLGDLAVHDGDAYVVRYQPVPQEYLDFEILRVDLGSGERELLHREALTISTSPQVFPGVPPVDIDLDAGGTIYLATPSYRIILAPDGTELSRAAQSANRPIVSADPDGRVLWWGGAEGAAHATSVIIGGSGEARDAIVGRASCEGLIRDDALRMTVGDAGAESTVESLPFLCGANAAAWTGDSWIVATGGEGDGVLVRLTPPAALD
ncbi:hypothetical protein [Microbacterium sp.]|uniref:hypothetical protein n=1 Tax=Microbacterium sp. TaxID=51671 RepID=UPI003F979568